MPCEIHTPASLIRRDGRAIAFRDLPKGATFECNGNVWMKGTTRTAIGIWPACLPSWAYFRGTELTYAHP